MNNLGFGMMRLPVKNGPTDFDYDQLNQMVDTFLAAGCSYFDTSYVYHNGKSQEAVRKALVERHPRESFRVATKFPTFNLVPEEQIDAVFESQLADLGVDYIDYYLLHNIQNVYYDGVDGKGGIIKTTHLFEHAQKRKAEGKIRQSTIDTYRGLLWNGVPVTAILQAYSICQIQPDPGFSDDNNYFKNALAEFSHLDIKGDLPHQQVITADGEDITELVEKAAAWLKANTF